MDSAPTLTNVKEQKSNVVSPIKRLGAFLSESVRMTPDEIEDMDRHSPTGLFIETGKSIYTVIKAVTPFVEAIAPFIVGAISIVIPGALDRFNKPDEHQPQ